MTFSTKSVCDTVRKTFTPVWESVSPTTVARYDLGDGRAVQGTIGGEIMIYFCRPDGVVFDAVPALQSPAIVQQAVRRAAQYWEECEGAPEASIRAYNRGMANKIAKQYGLTATEARARVEQAHKKLNDRLFMGSGATDGLTTSFLSKTLVVTPAEDITVVEPGGLWLYALQVHTRLAEDPLQTPMQWKKVMFEGILDQKLGGGTTTYDANELEPMQLYPGQYGTR